MKGLDLSDPDLLRQYVEQVVALIGGERIREQGATASGEGERLLRPLLSYLDGRADVHSQLFLAMIGYVIAQCEEAEGCSRLFKRLRDLARAGDYGQFFNVVFEGEAAVYWKEQMQAAAISFPASHHPDFWADCHVTGALLRLANECKRIAPADVRDHEGERLLADLDVEVGQIYQECGALNVIIWLHARVSNLNTAELASLLKKVAQDAAAHSPNGSWHTASDAQGLYQVSVAAVPALGEWAERTIQIEDAPAVGPLLCRVETRYLGKLQDPARLKYVVSVRSDVLPDRIRRFESNLGDAMNQVLKSAYTAPGVANIRLRPPRDLGDLYEADAIVRRALSDQRAAHVALVVLYWSEAEVNQEEGAGIARHSLTTHFIANPSSPVRFDRIDSWNSRFAGRPEILIRDPETGSLTSLDPELLRLMEHQPTANDERAATIYLKLKEPFPRVIQRFVIEPIVADGCAFVATFDDQQHFRVIQFRGRDPVRVATLDLRAWGGEEELLFHLLWKDEAWTLSSECPASRAKVVARSVPVRRAFL